ncbi:MAG: 30S ribosome-binding factor RbfA [Actinobacteria bacterium]|nr:30S ribosome-binding factor RbfA [Actinomycetota bacterium]
MGDKQRAAKLADRIQVIVAEMLERRIKDPRLGFVTITAVRMTPDLHDATVFYTVFGDDREKSETAVALESARGIIRSEVGKQTGVRYTPTIAFIADAVPENAAHIDDLLRVAAEADARVHEQAARATPAGDADPYRVPRELNDDDESLDEFDDEG